MNTEEKLIELLKRFETPVMFGDIELMKWTVPTPEILTTLVDYLIANGVTIPVRCKECEYNLHGGCSVEWEIRQCSENWFEQFCSEGKRKE